MAEDRHGPPTVGHGACRQEEVEVNLIYSLRLRRPSPGPERRNKLLGCLVVGRVVFPEGELPHRPWDEPKQRDVELDGGEPRRVVTRLPVERDARHRIQRKYCPGPAITQSEIGRRRDSRFDLVPDLLRDGRDTLGGEDAGDRNLFFVNPGLTGCLYGVQERLLVIATHILPEPHEGFGRFNRRAGQIPYAAGHDQCIPRVLIKEFVRLGMERERGRIPDDLIDADHLATMVSMTQRAAEADQKYCFAGDRRYVNRTIERNG